MPTALRKARGRPLPPGLSNPKEPKPKPELPHKPAGLDLRASLEWDRISVQLYHLGLLTSIDRTQLEIYCLWYSKMQEAMEVVKKFGMLTKGSAGQAIVNPAFRIASEATDKVQQCITRFGMSPSDRIRISVDAPDRDEDSDILDFFRRSGNPRR